MINYSFIKSLLRSEGGTPLSEETLDKFLALGEHVKLSSGKYIIGPGEVNKSLWITESGVTKAVYFDGKKEIVLGFSGPGTITISPLSFTLGKPAFVAFQTITECDMLRIRKSDFDKLMTESHEFACWMVGILISQFTALELKSQMLSEADIKSNYLQLVKRQMKLDKDGFDPNRPSLLSIVSSKDIASYLGITQSYLSNIRKAILDEERDMSSSQSKTRHKSLRHEEETEVKANNTD